MVTNKECVPIAIVSSVPFFHDGEPQRAEYWTVQVDFAGVCVPNISVFGGHVHEYYTEDTRNLYCGKYSFVTRVEYRFPNRRFINTCKLVCGFQNRIAKRIMKNHKDETNFSGVVARVWGLGITPREPVNFVTHDKNKNVR